MNNKFPEVLIPILRYYHAQNQGYVKKNDNSLNWGIPDLLEVLYILKNEKNTFPGMNNKFLEELSPILRSYHAQNQSYVKKTDNSLNWAIPDLLEVLYILEN